jgi:hypothetical protein
VLAPWHSWQFTKKLSAYIIRIIRYGTNPKWYGPIDVPPAAAACRLLPALVRPAKEAIDGNHATIEGMLTEEEDKYDISIGATESWMGEGGENTLS